MSRSSIPDALFSPLTSNLDLINALQAASAEPREVVVDRLYSEQACLGTNVRSDAAALGLTPYIWSDKFVEFYQTTKSFLYESAVWNRSPLKCQMRDWIGRFLSRNQLTDARILTYGDGLGIDSTYLAMLGCHVTYFEPSDECVRFAKSVFEQNGIQVHHISDTANLGDGTFDVIVCLDVLEHVPNPPETVGNFANWLRQDGLLITNSPFFYIEPYHPTHLQSNMRYSGDVTLFVQNGLQPFHGKLFWDPIVLKKCDSAPADRKLWKVWLGMWPLRLGRWSPVIHNAVARLMSRGEKKWLRGLERANGARPVTATSSAAVSYTAPRSEDCNSANNSASTFLFTVRRSRPSCRAVAS